MAAIIFDGRGFSDKLEENLLAQVKQMKRKPKLVTIVDPGNLASATYTRLKTRMAERLGVDFEVKTLNPKHEILNNIKILISQLNNDPKVDGIMIQVPFLNSDELIKLIDPRKDVDGLKKDGPFKPAVVRAVLTILKSQIPNPKNIMIVGSEGFVGRRLVTELGCEGMDKEDFDPSSLKLRRADVIISCTGQADLINGSMVKNGFMAIDVGYPKAEFAHSALLRASFYTPVPGGVGPVTVACLFKNLVEGVK